MLFRPNFCANCGERVERADWGILTSRRFCPVCESEFKGQDLIPRAVVVAGVLIGIFGVGGYLRSGTPTVPNLVAKPPAKQTNQATAANPPASQPANIEQTPRGGDLQSSMSMPRTLVSQPTNQTVQKPVEEIGYYCGAETKKGTPCSRRVKGNIRCYQHKGMPAMLPPEKLKIG
ncbi:MAG: hypothetical protein IPI64_09925 [Chloracidobacterium sp.]|nr:hypothetical protein [Chloracidobacterium sp.]